MQAVDAVLAGLETNDRGKLVMACGTGKTFTSLRLAEKVAGAGGSVLFLVPSISLLSQTLREWATEALVPLAPLAVCSDRKATARSKVINEDISAVDLALPATTNVALLQSGLTQANSETESMTVVFATYQSIDVVAQAQHGGQLEPFDVIICDEAHRTTGTTLAGEDETAFVRVHDAAYPSASPRRLPGHRRGGLTRKHHKARPRNLTQLTRPSTACSRMLVRPHTTLPAPMDARGSTSALEAMRTLACSGRGAIMP